VSNPPNPPYGQNPYGNEPPGDQPPYGGQPAYPGGEYGGQPAEPKTDGVSIAAFVTGLLCCAPVGLILGLVGLSRTKDNQRKGRWAAVVGVVLGALGVLAWIGAVIFVVFVANTVVTPDNAEVGQCVNVDTDGDEVSMTKKECSESHDGEIVAVEEVNSDNRDAIEAGMADYCTEAVSAEDLTVLQGRDDIDLKAVIEDPSNVDNGDHLVCYAEAKSGKLDEKILD
jgi:hypothetical protein